MLLTENFPVAYRSLHEVASQHLRQGNREVSLHVGARQYCDSSNVAGTGAAPLPGCRTEGQRRYHKLKVLLARNAPVPALKEHNLAVASCEHTEAVSRAATRYGKQ